VTRVHGDPQFLSEGQRGSRRNVGSPSSDTPRTRPAIIDTVRLGSVMTLLRGLYLGALRRRVHMK